MIMAEIKELITFEPILNNAEDINVLATKHTFYYWNR